MFETPLNSMCLDSGERMMAVYREGARSIQAIGAEMGDYTQRLLADSTATMAGTVKAQTPNEAIELWAAFSKRAMQEHVQQMSRLAAMYSTAAEEQTRAMQALILPVRR
jgi:hypothetical protein